MTCIIHLSINAIKRKCLENCSQFSGGQTEVALETNEWRKQLKFYRTPIFEWRVVMCVSKKGHLNNYMLKKKFTMPGSIVNIVRETHMTL